MSDVSYRRLQLEYKRLLTSAGKAMKTAYSPYSGFQVGAALLTPSGKIISGSNVECASYGLTICAERAALAAANRLEERIFTALAVIARGQNKETGEFIDTTKVTAPCGACRQLIYEFRQIGGSDEKSNTVIVLATTNKNKVVLTSIDELIPNCFGPIDLGVDVSTYRPK